MLPMAYVKLGFHNSALTKQLAIGRGGYTLACYQTRRVSSFMILELIYFICTNTITRREAVNQDQPHTSHIHKHRPDGVMNWEAEPPKKQSATAVQNMCFQSFELCQLTPTLNNSECFTKERFHETFNVEQFFHKALFLFSPYIHGRLHHMFLRRLLFLHIY